MTTIAPHAGPRLKTVLKGHRTTVKTDVRSGTSENKLDRFQVELLFVYSMSTSRL